MPITIPYRGYRARKAAGQNPPQLRLPKYRRPTPTSESETVTRKPPAVPERVVREGAELPGIRSIHSARPSTLHAVSA
jgi:hypothetical protein